MKRILSLLMAFVLLVSLTTTVAFSASSSNYVKISRATIAASATTIRVGQMAFLDVNIRPSDADYDTIEWSSSDEDVAYVNDYGDVEALEEGTVYIYARIIGTDSKGNPDKRLATAEIKITVVSETGSITSSSESSSSSASSSSRSSSASAGGTTNTLGKIPTATVTNSVSSNVKRGTTGNSIFRNYESVSAATLASAATAAKNAGGTAMLHFDTLNAAGKAVEGRLSFNPANAGNVKGDIALGIYTNDEATGATRTKFEKYFTNKVVIIKAMQKNTYNMTVKFAVKIGTELAKSKQLMLYSYDPTTNKYTIIKNSNIRIDENGYVHFNTALGDYLVISDGALTLR